MELTPQFFLCLCFYLATVYFLLIFPSFSGLILLLFSWFFLGGRVLLLYWVFIFFENKLKVGWVGGDLEGLGEGEESVEIYI